MSNGKGFGDRLLSMFIPLYVIAVVVVAGFILAATISGLDPAIIEAAMPYK